MTLYYGKYRGKVESNTDPNQLGRIQVSVPSVLGEGQMSWAMPCTPYGGSSVGWFAIPPVGTNVWVEFEAGNTDYPIWSGCFWGTGECPASPPMPPLKVLKTHAATITVTANTNWSALTGGSGAGGLTAAVGALRGGTFPSSEIGGGGVARGAGAGLRPVSATSTAADTVPSIPSQ